MNHHLYHLLEIADQIVPETIDLVAPLSDLQRTWRPTPIAWSIAHCYDHLTMTGTFLYPTIRKTIQLGRDADIGDIGKSFSMSWIGNFASWLAGTDCFLRFRTHSILEPEREVSPNAPFIFCEQQKILKQLLRDADGLDLQRVRVHFPFNRFFTLSLGDCLSIVVMHQQRHIVQSVGITQTKGFPQQCYRQMTPVIT